jgi:hypothetical protein
MKLKNALREGVPKGVPEPKKKGLECPVCGGKTVCRDVGEDGYYVEWCSGGVLKWLDEETGEIEEFECPYWDAGWERRSW